MTARKRGFTLIELMVAVGVTVIIVTAMASVFKISTSVVGGSLKQASFYSRLAFAHCKMGEELFSESEVQWNYQKSTDSSPAGDIVKGSDINAVLFPLANSYSETLSSVSYMVRGKVIEPRGYSISGFFEVSRADIVSDEEAVMENSSQIELKMYFPFRLEDAD